VLQEALVENLRQEANPAIGRDVSEEAMPSAQTTPSSLSASISPSIIPVGMKIGANNISK